MKSEMAHYLNLKSQLEKKWNNTHHENTLGDNSPPPLATTLAHLSKTSYLCTQKQEAPPSDFLLTFP